MYWVSVGNGKVLYSQDEINSNHNPYNHSHHKSHRVITDKSEKWERSLK